MTTETSKHTPGPWEVLPFSTGRDWDIYAPDGIVIATSFGDDKEHTANARLMAAAPDMLTALEFTRSFIAGIEGLHIGSSWWKLIDDAIAKARGAA